MAITNMPLGVTAVMLPELDFDEQLALCRRLGVTHYSLRPRVIGEKDRDKPFSNWGNHKFDLTPERLVRSGAEIRRRIVDAGLVPFGTVPNASTASSDDELKMHFEGAAAAGAGRVRVGPEGYPKTPFDYAELLKKVVDRYGQIVAMAKPYGLKLVIETHAWSLAASPALAWNLVRHFSPAEMGTMFDLPNFAREGNQVPVLGVAILRDYIDQLHVGGSRRVAGSYDALGFVQVKDQFCPLSESDMHLPSWLAALRDAGVAAPLILEDYTETMPGALRLEDSVRQVRRVLEAL